jgi:hypothetical protein
MKTSIKLVATLALSIGTASAFADSSKDCMLEGTVQKGSSSSGEQNVSVKFHSVEKYDQDANCRVRRDQKMEFQLPDDPRLKDADAGSQVKYRYRTDGDGNAKTELISVGA